MNNAPTFGMPSAQRAYSPTTSGLGNSPAARLRKVVVVAALMFALASVGAAQSTSAASSSGDRTRAEALTTQLLSLQQQIQAAPGASRSQLRDQLNAVAAARHNVLARLMDTDPKTVERLAIPASLRIGLPLAAQAALEREVQLEGKLEVVYEDSPQQSKLRHFLDVGGQRLELRFGQHPPTHLLTGAIVHVHGVQIEQKVAVASGTSSTSLATVAAAPLPSTFGDQKTLVILVNFQNNTSQPYTPTFAHDMTFTTTSNFDMENSYGQTWLTGNVAGWYTIPTNSTCDYPLIGTLANQAATAAGVNVSAYSHLVYGFPAASCGWWGVSFVGGNQSWVTGNYALAVVAHEMGHQFGLYHSHSLNCLPNIVSGTCTTVEYGDTLDMMGNPRNFAGGDFNAFQKERLGWLNYGSSPSIMTVQSNGTYTIGPYEAQDGTAKALKIFKSKDPTTGATTWYYVEYRQAAGFDSFLSSYTNITHGVIVRLGTDSDANSSDLLDLTPTLSSWMAVGLDAGLTFTDPSTGTSIKTVSADSSSATVSVTLNSSSSTCTHAMPTLAISPSQSTSVAAGATVAYTVSLKNNDSSACSASMFTLSPSVPSGWVDSLSNSSLTLGPGASASSTLQVSSPIGITSGLYKVGSTASNTSATSYQASASATYVIGTTTTSALALRVTTPLSTYTLGQQSVAWVTAKVSSGQSAIVGANVVITVVDPRGSVTTFKGTTKSWGGWQIGYKLPATALLGTYQVQATASYRGASAKAASVFTVK